MYLKFTYCTYKYHERMARAIEWARGVEVDSASAAGGAGCERVEVANTRGTLRETHIVDMGIVRAIFVQLGCTLRTCSRQLGTWAWRLFPQYGTGGPLCASKCSTTSRRIRYSGLITLMLRFFCLDDRVVWQ